MDSCSITLTFSEGSLNAVCRFEFSEPLNYFEFSLSERLAVVGMSVGQPYKPRWGDSCRIWYTLSPEPFRTLELSYSGTPQGWCNTIQENLIALSSYSSWFPFNAFSEANMPVSLTCMVILPNLGDWFVVNGRQEENIWIYGDEIHENCNIIALKEGTYRKASAANFAYYYRNSDELDYAECCAEHFPKIIEYYISAFGKREIAKLDIVSLMLPGEHGGAYFRRELIVCGHYFPEEHRVNWMNAAVLLAHEIGHNWFADADVDTWEDWLNETGAEWAALLYALHLGDEELFTRELESSTSGYANTPAIKTSDGSRPYEGVHSRGTALFYSIYLKYGADTVLWLLQTLAELSTPTTAYFISAVKAQRPELAEYIEYGLTAISY